MSQATRSRRTETGLSGFYTHVLGTRDAKFQARECATSCVRLSELKKEREVPLLFEDLLFLFIALSSYKILRIRRKGDNPRIRKYRKKKKKKEVGISDALVTWLVEDQITLSCNLSTLDGYGSEMLRSCGVL
jgi:hypothetical protein